MEKVMPNVGLAAAETVSSSSPKTVKASDKNAFSKLVNKSKSKTQTKVNQKNAGQNNDEKDDGKKVSDNSKQNDDDKKVAIKDQQSDEKQTEKDQTTDETQAATVQAEVQPVQVQEVKAISETDVKPSVTENKTSDAATVSEVSESDSDQKSATIQQTIMTDVETEKVQAQPIEDADEKTQASVAAPQDEKTVDVQTNVQTSQERMQAVQATSVVQTQQTAQNQVQQATNQQQQTQTTVKVEEVGTVQNVEAQASDAKVDFNELATLNNQSQTLQSAPADTKAAFSAKMNVATTRAAEKLAQPIVEKISTSVAPNGGLKTITLQLTPAKLGNVRVVMHVSEQGISLKFNVQTDQAKQLLQSVTGKLEQILKNAEANSTQRATQSFNLQKTDQPETVTKTPQFEQDTSSLLNSNQNGAQQFNQNGMRQMRTVNGYRKAPVLEAKQEDDDKKEQVPTSTISILA